MQNQQRTNSESPEPSALSCFGKSCTELRPTLRVKKASRTKGINRSFPCRVFTVHAPNQISRLLLSTLLYPLHFKRLQVLAEYLTIQRIFRRSFRPDYGDGEDIWVQQARGRAWRGLECKVVMVTGASSDIGREISLDLAAAGCFIVAAAGPVHRLHSVCEEISQMTSSKAAHVALDLASAGSGIDHSVQKAWDLFGRIDALVNNGDVGEYPSSPLELPQEERNSVIRTSLRGTWQMTKSVCRRMHQVGIKGSVINVSSLDGALHYAETKTGIDCLTRVMRKELGPLNIMVNSISPALFESEITAGLIKKKCKSNRMRRIKPLMEVNGDNPSLTSVVRLLLHDDFKNVIGSSIVVNVTLAIVGFPIFPSL